MLKYHHLIQNLNFGPSMKKGSLLSLIALLICINEAVSQESVNSMINLLDTGYFARKTTEHIKVDGYIAEQTWEKAQKATNFIQNFPVDSLMSKSKTEVMVTYDDKHLYVAARMFNTVKNSSM